MNKTLWLDVDGVLLDWVRPFLHFIDSPVKYEELLEYDLSSLFGGDKLAMRKKIDEFNLSPGYRCLQPLATRDELELLKYRGYDLHIITQTTGDKSALARSDNLADMFGREFFKSYVYTRHGENKAELLRAFEPYEIIHVVEDNPEFFKQAATVGGLKAMAIQHPYNRLELLHTPNVPIYTSTHSLVRHLLGK